MSDDYRAGDADGLTGAGMIRMIDWLHGVKKGQVASANDVVMCDLLAYEIERLRDLNETFKHDAKNQRDIVEQQQIRIEELEKDVRKEWLVGYEEAHSEGHIITTDQIRAAWEIAVVNGPEALWPLEELGIVRCEGCGGRARGWIDNDPNVEGSYEAVCPDCNGEGFVIGGEDE